MSARHRSAIGLGTRRRYIARFELRLRADEHHVSCINGIQILRDVLGSSFDYLNRLRRMLALRFSRSCQWILYSWSRLFMMRFSGSNACAGVSASLCVQSALNESIDMLQEVKPSRVCGSCSTAACNLCSTAHNRYSTVQLRLNALPSRMCHCRSTLGPCR